MQLWALTEHAVAAADATSTWTTAAARCDARARRFLCAGALLDALRPASALEAIGARADDRAAGDATAARPSSAPAIISASAAAAAAAAASGEGAAGDARGAIASDVAAAAAFSALLSSTQRSLVEHVAPARGGELEWPRARALRLPFWVRDAQLLRRVAEDMARARYRRTKDIFEAFPLYACAGARGNTRVSARVCGKLGYVRRMRVYRGVFGYERYTRTRARAFARTRACVRARAY